jgi:hypothetical protein
MDQIDEDALELLRKLLLPPPLITFYFHYDPLTGMMKSLKPYLDNDDVYPYVTATQEEVENDICLDEYYVLEVDGIPKLIKRDRLSESISKIDDNIYQIPKSLADPAIKISQINYQFDLLIEQDNIKKEFRIRLSGMMKDQHKDNVRSKQEFTFYVTEENDPNILFTTLDIRLDKLLQYHYYTIPYDTFDSTRCNIFSKKYFATYLHLVIE